MILLCILVAWIAGIAQIGTAVNLSLLPLMLLLQLLGLFILSLHWMQYLHLAIWCKWLIVLCCTLSSFFLGHSYANHRLEQQLQYREQQTSNTTVVIFVDHIAEKSH